MRVALVVERFQPGGGGVEQAAWNVAAALARAGNEVDVVARSFGDTGQAAGGFESSAKHRVGARARSRAASGTGTLPGITLHLARTPTAWQPLRVLAFSMSSRRVLREQRPRFDVIHSFCRTRHQHIYRAGGGSHADSMERTYSPVGVALRRASPRHRVLLGIESAIFGDPQQTIQCVSNRVRDEIRARWNVPDERLCVLHNGVDHDRFHPRRHLQAASAIGRELDLEPGTTRWLFAGSGAQRKGLDTALRALAAAKDPSARLLVAGRDNAEPWRRLAHQLGIAARVRFLGARSDMPAVYASADAFLLPTRYDPFANVCLEAAATGLPVVTSGTNGAAEVVGAGGIIISDPEDVAGFAGAIRALSSADVRDTLGKAGRDIATRHGWDDHSARLCDLYRRVSQQQREASPDPSSVGPATP